MYSTTPDIVSRVPFTLDDKSTPTIAQALSYQAEVNGEIDSVLASQGFTVPVTGPSYFLSALAKVEADGTAARVLRTMFPDSRGPGETTAWGFYEVAYRDAIKRWERGLGYPKGADVDVLTPSSYFTANASEDQGPIFTERDQF